MKNVNGENKTALGINISHNPSICIYKNNKAVEFYNEERFIDVKNCFLENINILQSILQKVKNKPDIVCYASYEDPDHQKELDIISSIQKQLGHPKYFFNFKNHHIYHATSGYYFSKFDEALAIVVDGGGSYGVIPGYQEIESIYYINKQSLYSVYKHYSNAKSQYNLGFLTNLFENNYPSKHKYVDHCLHKFSTSISGGFLFQLACKLVFDSHESMALAGKLMGLSSYGYTDTKYSLNYSHVEIAKQVQEKSFADVCELVERAITIKNCKNIILSGGLFLNCSNNFKLVKKYPELNFFVDPIPHDAGTALGACIYNEHYKD